MLLSLISGHLWYFYYTIECLFIQGKEIHHLPTTIFSVCFCVFRRKEMHYYRINQDYTSAALFLQVRQLTSAYPYVRRQCRYYRLSDSSTLFQSSEQRIYHILRNTRRKYDLYSVFTDNDVFLWTDFWNNSFRIGCTALLDYAEWHNFLSLLSTLF